MGIVDDPALVNQAQSIADHPATATRPFLRHFLVADGHGTGHGGGGGRVGSEILSYALAVLLTAAAGWTLSAIVRTHRRQRLARAIHADPSAPPPPPPPPPRWSPGELRRRVRRARRTHRTLAVGALVLLAAPVSIFVGGGTKAALGVIEAARHAAHPPLAVARPSAGITPSAQGMAAWRQLMSVEQTLAQQHDALVAQESRVRQLTLQLQQVIVPPSAPAEVPAAAATPPAGAVASQAGTLSAMVATYQVTLTAYQQSLEREYQLFVAVASNPVVRSGLLATAAASGQPDARAAVGFDLTLVQAQLSQEAAIDAAVAQAQAEGPADGVDGLRAAGRPSLQPPLGGELTQGFGPTDLSIEAPATHDGVFYPHFHTGLDISGPFGTPVRAAADGRVILATSSVDDQGHLVGYGNYVVIAHSGGLSTVYGHLETISVRQGQLVHQGDVIGLEGSTGNSTGPHVHFETRLNGGIVDPSPYLAGKLHR